VSGQLLARYQNGGTECAIYADGTKVRTHLNDTPPVLCEQMDLKITDWCDAGCAWCHEGSTKRGRHGDIGATLALLRPLPAGVEIAIGGGDPLSHPRFEDLVRALRAQGLVPSVTVNGRHLARSLPLLKTLTSEGALFGVGVSYAGELPSWDYEHLVLHLIAGLDGPEVLERATTPLKVLLLGYKRHGRGEHLYQLQGASISARLERWYRELFWVAQEHKLSFDNLAISQLKPQRLFSNAQDFADRYMGPEGAHSMYIDAVTQTYGLSSYAKERFPWTQMQDMFAHVHSLREPAALAA
jgi:hypothetical protein